MHSLLPLFFAMVLRIYVARHGQDEDNACGVLNGHRDKPLTKLGEEQATIVAKKLVNANLKLDYVYSSPLQRSLRTAEILISKKSKSSSNGADHPSIEIMDDLIERNFGVMTGTLTKEIAERCKGDVLQTDTICYFLSPEGAETFPDLIERANKLLDEIQSKHSKGSVLLVTHGDFGKMLYCAYYKLDWQEVLSKFHFGNSEVLLLSKETPPDHAHIFQVDQYNP